MKKILQLMFCAGVLTALLAGTALAAAGTSTEGYTTANDNCTVTYNADTGKYTAAYNGEDLIDGNQYVLLVVKGSEDNYSVGENTIMYIDQTATESGVSFDFIPKSTPDCVVLLGGVFNGADSPKVLGTLVGRGVTVSGSVTSYNPNVAVTVELYNTGTTANPAYTTTIAASSGSGQVTQYFDLTGVAEGTYDLKVTKAGHTAYWVTGIPVGSEDLTIEDAISLLCGDVDESGSINMLDLNTVLRSDTYNKSAQAAEKPEADLDGSASINIMDLNIILSTNHYNKGTVKVPYEP